MARSTLLLLGLIVTAAVPGTLRDISQNIVNLFGELPDAVRYALIGLAQLTIVAIPLAVIAWLILRRSWLETTMVVGAGAVGGIVMALLTNWLARAAPPVPSGLDSASFLPTDFPSSAYLAALVAGTATAAPLMPDRVAAHVLAGGDGRRRGALHERHGDAGQRDRDGAARQRGRQRGAGCVRLTPPPTRRFLVACRSRRRWVRRRRSP